MIKTPAIVNAHCWLNLLVKEPNAKLKTKKPFCWQGLKKNWGVKYIWGYWLNRLVPQEKAFCLGKPAYYAMWGSWQGQGLWLWLLALVTDDI